MLKGILNLLMTHLGLKPAFISVLEPVLEKAAVSGFADATVAAEPIVADLEKATLPDSEKFTEAAKQVGAKLESQGTKIANSTINLAVELAVQKLKASL